MTDFRWRREFAQRDADAPVLIGSDRTWRAAEIVAELDDLGERLVPTRVLGVLADNGPAWAMSDLAAQDAGVVHLPLPAFFGPAQLRHAIERAAVDTIVTDQPERIGALDLQFAETGSWRGLTWMRRVVDPVQLPPGTAKISFTSGSTGAPKGVCLDAAGLRATARAVCARLADLPLARHLAVLPLALLLENVAGLYAPLLRGVPVCLPSLTAIGWRGMSGFDPAALDAEVRHSAASSVILVPELLKAWTALLARRGGLAASDLRFAAVGGARVVPEVLHQARRLGIPAHQGYGLTECGSVVSLNRPGDDGDNGDDCGRPLEHAQVRIEDGEVIVRAPSFRGYLGDTMAIAPTAPATPTRADFHTGDLGEIDVAGHVHLTGRRKNLLITSFGRNIAPEWVEATLLAQPAILQAVVVGEGRPYLAALVVPSPGAQPGDVDAAIESANALLPDYARVAKRMLVAPFTFTDGLATGNGRPIRSAIVERHAERIAALYSSQLSKETEDVVL